MDPNNPTTNCLIVLVVVVLGLIFLKLSDGSHGDMPRAKRPNPQATDDGYSTLEDGLVYYRPMYRRDPDKPPSWENTRFGKGRFMPADEWMEIVRSFPQEYIDIIHDIGIENWPAYCREHGISNDS